MSIKENNTLGVLRALAVDLVPNGTLGTHVCESPFHHVELHCQLQQ